MELMSHLLVQFYNDSTILFCGNDMMCWRAVNSSPGIHADWGQEHLASDRHDYEFSSAPRLVEGHPFT